MKSFLVLITLALTLANPTYANSTLKSAARIANKQNEADGIPFRWVLEKSGGNTIMTLQMLPLPTGRSKADATLTADTLKSISEKEQAKGRATAVLKEVRLMPDGGEVWILESDVGIAYVVHFADSPQGGVDMTLAGPFSYTQR